jgi:transcriptional regulator with XRE-family HTH domain
MKLRVYLKNSAGLQEEFTEFSERFRHSAEIAEALGVSRTYITQIAASTIPMTISIAKKVKKCTKGEIDFIKYFKQMESYKANHKTFKDIIINDYLKKIASYLAIDMSTFMRLYVPIGVLDILNKKETDIDERDLKILKKLYKINYNLIKYDLSYLLSVND